MQFTKEKEIDGVMQRDFTVEYEGEKVPCVIWSPKAAKGPRTLIVMGHGGSQHKKTAGIRSRAVEYAQKLGWATIAADAPGHGDRISREDAVTLAREVGARVRGETAAPFDEARMKQMTARGQRASGEWRAMLDAVQGLDFVGSRNVGYWGISMGTAFGVPFVASEPRIRCAIFGLAGLRAGATAMAEAAAKITVPIEFVFQWEDAVAPRESGIALFNAFASIEKTMHINPGGHVDIPDFERDAWLAFFVRHLG